MTTVIAEFETRVKEVDLYFKFLNELINDNAQLYFEQRSRNRKSNIDPELLKVLKANGFLLLYNLIEASTKKSIEKIYEKVSAEDLQYKDFRDEVKMRWIDHNYKNFQQKGSEEIFKAIEKIASDTINIKFNSKKVISGNVDALKIREFAAIYGFSDRTHYLAKNGSKLHFVKTNRNDLAHGVVSFAECGRQHTFEDLNKTRKEVIVYMRGILKNVDEYINKKLYLRKTA